MFKKKLKNPVFVSGLASQTSIKFGEKEKIGNKRNYKGPFLASRQSQG